MSRIQDFSVAQVAEITGLSEAAVRWHCRVTRGLLYGPERSYKLGRDWAIHPVAAFELKHHLEQLRGGPGTSDPPR